MTSEFRLDHPDALPSPSLLIFLERLQQNLRTMLALAGDPARLRPHVKTHKMPDLVALLEEYGFHKHKCATIAEAEMLATAGAGDVLIAYPLVGPNLLRLSRLLRAFPATTFRVTVDDPAMVRLLAGTLSDLERPLPVLLDLDVGMERTGIAPGHAAEALYELIAALPPLEPDGLHVYDGHLGIPDPARRRAAAVEVQDQALALRDRLEARSLPVPRLVLGGTPTFPFHAALEAPGVECSPGTCTLYDAGYATKFPDLPFVPAAALLTRVVSRPRPGRLCLDLGHKAVAGDPPVDRRVVLPALPEATFTNHSEEHLVVATSRAAEFPVGTPLLALPAHICPTCALHRRAFVIADGQWTEQWEVVARDRVLTV